MTQTGRADDDASDVLLYEKDPTTKIATITLNRPDQLNAPTIAMRLRYAKLLDRAAADGVPAAVEDRDGPFGDYSAGGPARRPDPTNVIG